MVWLITFTCYGTRFHAPDVLGKWEERQMKMNAYSLDQRRRRVVLESICRTCRFRDWRLLAAHVRTNHVHALVALNRHSPEQAMTSFKAHASRALGDAGLGAPKSKVWTRHGSTVPIRGDFEKAIRYVVDGQGTPMEFLVGQRS